MIISHYLLNYFPGLDIDRRNCHGFTALMKAAMQGRAEVVRALMLAGKTHTVHLWSNLDQYQSICSRKLHLVWCTVMINVLDVNIRVLISFVCIDEWKRFKKWGGDNFNYVSRKWYSGTGQRPQYDPQGVGSLHWSIRDCLSDVSADVKALCWAVLWHLPHGVAHAGGKTFVGHFQTWGNAYCLLSPCKIQYSVLNVFFLKLLSLNHIVWPCCPGAGGQGPRTKVLLEAFDQPPVLLPL